MPASPTRAPLQDERAEHGQSSPQIKGVQRLSRGRAAFQRWLVLLFVVGPLAGVALAIVALWGRGVDPLDLVLFATFYAISGLGVTVGFHRLLTHRAFDTPRWVRYALAVAGTLALEGSVLDWCADHRRHHAYSDQPGDPHSPHTHGDEDSSIRATIGNLWHAHLGWMFMPERTCEEQWTPDLASDVGLQRINRAFGLIVAAGFLLPAAIGYLVTGTWTGALLAFLWGGLARVFLLHHVTFSINLICHVWGRRSYRTTDESRNVWPLALLSFGESWHNNHHAFPSSARHGLRAWQIDLSDLMIRGMELTRLATNVRRPSAATLARRRI